MGVFQNYGVYLIVLGILLIIAGLILGYLASLPNDSTTLYIPPTIQPDSENLPKSPGTLPLSQEIDTVHRSGNADNVLPVIGAGIIETANAPTRSDTASINLAKIEQLERIKRLLDQGVLTQEQFATMQQQILDA